jgi:hypothetical protein
MVDELPCPAEIERRGLHAEAMADLFTRVAAAAPELGIDTHEGFNGFGSKMEPHEVITWAGSKMELDPVFAGAGSTTELRARRWSQRR